MQSLRTRPQLSLRHAHVTRFQAWRQPIVAVKHRPSRTEQLLLRLQHDVRDSEVPSPLLPTGRLLGPTQPYGRPLDAWHPRGGPWLRLDQLPRRSVAPRVPTDGVVMVSELLLQAIPSFYRLTQPSNRLAPGSKVYSSLPLMTA
jgi:hypothetical protein